jgi:hypothetical protein
MLRWCWGIDWSFTFFLVFTVLGNVYLSVVWVKLDILHIVCVIDHLRGNPNPLHSEVMSARF